MGSEKPRKVFDLLGDTEKGHYLPLEKNRE